jgi:NAD(P)-dependent dehydrogenase (short-subunit alcohol dehydrogenase family)
MEITGRVVVVTGAGSGIGRALALAFAEGGASAVVCVDLSKEQAQTTASLVAGRGCTGVAYGADVARESSVISVVDRTTNELGLVDIFCSNAGITTEGGIETPDSDWRRLFDVNVMSHVFAARAVLPQMLTRGEGYLVNTASAAGLLTNLGAAAYSVTKHAAVALAEWLSITYGDAGVRVSCLCPQGVDTPMLRGEDGDASAGAGGVRGSAGQDSVARRAVKLAGEVVSPARAAEAVIDGIRAERFLIFTHPEIRRYMERRAADTDRWIVGMRRVLHELETTPGDVDPNGR